MAYLALQATMYSPTSGPLLKVVLKRQIKCSIVITIILRTCALNYRLALNEKWSNSAKKKKKRKKKRKEKREMVYPSKLEFPKPTWTHLPIWLGQPFWLWYFLITCKISLEWNSSIVGAFLIKRTIIHP